MIKVHKVTHGMAQVAVVAKTVVREVIAVGKAAVRQLANWFS